MNKRLWFSAFGLCLLASGFILLNWLASQLLPQQQLDLTQQRIYSLSQPSLELLQQMQQQVQLRLYYSAASAKDLPQIRRHARHIRELLEQYQRLAAGKIDVQVLQPEPFSSLEDQAISEGLQAVNLASGEQLFLGLAASNQQGQSHSIAFLDPQQEQLLEYQISRLLQRLQQPAKARIALIDNLDLDGSFDLISGQSQPAWHILQEVRQQYAIRKLAAGTDHIPAEIDVLWLVQPQDLPQHSLYAIDQFVLRGGKLLLFLDPFSEQLPGHSMASDELQARSADLPQLLHAWGLRLRSHSVVADSTYAMPVSVSGQSTPVQHLTWLNLTGQSLNRQQQISAGLGNISLASAGILEPLENASTSFVPLLQSSGAAMPLQSGRLPGLRNPAELTADFQATGERYSMAAHISGPARSIFPDGIEGRTAPVTQAQNIELVVVADTDLLHDSMWLHDSQAGNQPAAWADNASFVLNILDSLSGNQLLANIRSQVQRTRPFTLVDSMRRQAQQKFARQQHLLLQRLEHTEQQLQQLQAQPHSAARQQQALDGFLQQRLEIRQQLRQVQYQLNSDIRALGFKVKLFNIVLMPVLLCSAILLFAVYRRHRREVSDAA